MKISWHHMPARLMTGAFIVNSGMGKLRADDDTAAQMHGWASDVYPPLRRMPPRQFIRLLGAGETTLGAALMVPIVPSALTGAGLSAFAGGLLGLYAKTPGMRKPGSIFPTSEGIPMAKDSWLLGMGLTLTIGDLLDRQARRGAQLRTSKK